MTTAVYIYIVYTIISISMTVWVARTLHKNGRIFLYGPFAGVYLLATFQDQPVNVRP